jgi:hypothetical protein
VDGYRLAASGRQSNFDLGIEAALGWVLGLNKAPITGDDALATPETVEIEFVAAGEVEVGLSPRGAVVAADTAQAVRRTLAWLLGRTPNPPIELPRRPVPTAEQLYEETLAAEPHRSWLPEERNAARLVAVREAVRLAQLAARADSLAPP